MGRPEQLRDSEGIENKVSRAVYRIYSPERNRCGQTTVTTKKSQLERKTTPVTINSNRLSYNKPSYLKPIQRTAQLREKSRRKKAQLYRLSDPLGMIQDRFSFLDLQSKRFFRCAVFSSSQWWRGSAREVKACNLQTSPLFSKTTVGNSHPCRNVTPPQAKIMNRYLFCLSYSQISKRTSS